MATIKSRKYFVASCKQSSAAGMLKAATLFTSLALAFPAVTADLGAAPDADRKSTRLNSSH